MKYIKSTCQYCEKDFVYQATSGKPRKACFDCIPKGHKPSTAEIKRLIKDKAVRRKGSKSAVCGGRYPNAVYDFHHLVPGEKDFHLGDKNATTKWETIEKELEKCILVCANCHRTIHSGDIELD